MSGGSIFVRSRGGRRSLLAWPATQILVERTRPRFAKSSKPGTARPSWTYPPRERVERPESRMRKSLGPIRAVLAEVLAMYGKGQMGPFASDAVMRKHFTAQFISLWDRAIARNDGTIDADPFTDQGGNSVNLQGVDIIAETPNAATVEMHRLRDQSGQQHLSRNPKNMDAPRGSELEDRRHSWARRMNTWRGFIEKALAK